ncbi:MAG: aspartate aminotransferase family protein [Pseudomonadales bacterium]|jgi:acetylornithine/N-succinyldiaminopimelate aminotransferase|nr:aspartate aminotransferase family protein [Pseudomonadales bacterium]MEC8813060.1 aspartate aminotransferase family protein [Pseudomonadota bacterium]TNC88519.1 MAG: aspartate aminotransferase family protein [Alcanivorax sp.]HAG96865.1 aspartate aminotransferase family protein [Gammaproteobacteria bacterium]HAU16679.1 aspartate aminotransferase family protein [Gammaproteobacteria bacterium]|tara:strand:+ start:1505 stop:2683 length:1179 start_codon:yes stop_codon:yes gene_type:complete
MATSGLMTTYKPMSVTFEKGDGVWLYDTEGKQYLDCITGIAVCGLGHCHPRVTQTIQDQAQRLVHTSNLYRIRYQEELGARLAEISNMEACFFGNSGAEANECAIKIARLYGHNKGIEKPAIVVADQSFHGRTLATLSATGNRKVQAGFEPLVQGFVRSPYNDLDAIRTIAANNTNVVAVMVEPVQGEGGINIPADDYLSGLRQICDDNGWLLILDEIQTGNGRTGTYFNYQQHGILPDVVTTAKGLGNGLPIGACLARGEAANTLKPGNHGSTYGGNPLCCATALTVVNTLVEENLPQRAAELGRRIVDNLKTQLESVAMVREVRGKGLMIGIELTQACSPLVALAKDRGLLINVTAEKVIRLLPALTMSDEESDNMVNLLSQLIKEYAAQ